MCRRGNGRSARAACPAPSARTGAAVGPDVAVLAGPPRVRPGLSVPSLDGCR